MHLTDHDLLQLDSNTLERLDEGSLRRLSGRLLADLKEARDRLNQDSKNSSRPPSSDSPYGRSRRQPAEDAPTHETDGDDPGAAQAADETSPPVEEGAKRAADQTAERTAVDSPRDAKRAPGRQPGAPGHGRVQSLAVTDTRIHRPYQCACCGESLSETLPGHAFAGYDEIDLLPADPGAPGLVLSVTRHLPFEVSCRCGHRTRYRSPRIEVPGEWRGPAQSVNSCSARGLPP